MASVLTVLPEMVSAWLMFFVQSIINFLVPSGSGQAALTMPLMAPLGDLVGIERQVSVLCFQLGDSITNLIIPTSATLMGVLGAARIEWGHLGPLGIADCRPVCPTFPDLYRSRGGNRLPLIDMV